MLKFLEAKPVLRFFGEVILMVCAASLVIWIFGLIQNWSSPLDYSDGFFFAFVALAAIGSSRAVLMRPGYFKKIDPEASRNRKELTYNGKVDRYFATRSFNFKMLMAAVVCLAISMWVAQ
jgi:hypothetical protein